MRAMRGVVPVVARESDELLEMLFKDFDNAVTSRLVRDVEVPFFKVFRC